jgi:hypothetical protein
MIGIENESGVAFHHPSTYHLKMESPVFYFNWSVDAFWQIVIFTPLESTAFMLGRWK